VKYIPYTPRSINMMKAAKLFLLSLALSTSAVADTTRLALWVTDSIGATSGVQCNLQTPSTPEPSLPATKPTLTENDVTTWNAENGHWTLNPARYSGTDGAQKLQDRCFVLAIDGKLISSGVVLSSHSARLTRFPTLSVYNRDHSLDLRLTSGNRGSQSTLIHVDALNDVLERGANLKWQLHRIRSITAEAQYSQDKLLQIGHEWTAAVQKLIDQKQIRKDVPIAHVIMHLAPPTSITTPEGNHRNASYLWYFDTPRHVNPTFNVQTEDGMVHSYSFGHR